MVLQASIFGDVELKALSSTNLCRVLVFRVLPLSLKIFRDAGHSRVSVFSALSSCAGSWVYILVWTRCLEPEFNQDLPLVSIVVPFRGHLMGS